MSYNEDDDSSASGHDEPWIQWFCGLKGHEMFCEVERSYIEDGFNLYGLRACVSNFSDCLDLILDRIGPDDSDDSHLTQSACTLYGLIHARYIITAHGLDAMYNKYAARQFGTCPLIQCSGQPALPVGLRDEMGADTVKIYCPRCQSVYHPPPARSRPSHHGPGPGSGSDAIDGAAFGTTFPHLFLMTFNNLVPKPLNSKSKYVPRVFGFRVHDSARQRPPTTGTGSAGRKHGGGSGHAASASRSGAGRAVEASAEAAAAAGPSSPPAEAGLAAVPADGGMGQQNGKGGTGKAGPGRGGLPAGAAGGSRSGSSGGAKRAGAKGGSIGSGSNKDGGGDDGGGGGGRNRTGQAEKRKVKDSSTGDGLLDGAKGGGLGDEGSSLSRKKQKKVGAS
mmetsp:Transcript_37655/g.82483  ORF Transcript_37655/g.82483 Transcript_37655/m.82483 type:complete len:392 (+) Transcript_37655:392-1567(+)